MPMRKPASGAHSAQPERGIETSTDVRAESDIKVLIQHNPNEGLKLSLSGGGAGVGPVLIQHNPNEGLKPA